MEQHILDAEEESLLRTLQRRYAYLAAWLLRLNRVPEPPRPPDPIRTDSPSRTHIPTRQPLPPRPQ
ncbi:MAG: hypothetical protein PS018_16940 [bacterium]|nr:hypothetical protein [bacterium]